MNVPVQQALTPGDRLTSWKEIARFFDRDERTVKRWENERGLPIHRIPGQGRSKIYADVGELQTWLKSGHSAKPEQVTSIATTEPLVERTPAKAPGRLFANRPMVGFLLVAACALILGFGGGLLLRSVQNRSAASSNDAQATEIYRQGVHDLNAHTAAGVNRALDEFTQALVRDPNFADAYVGLGECYNLLREYADLPDLDAYPRVEAAADRALLLNPRSGAAYGLLGVVDFYWHWNSREAEHQFKRALELEPGSAQTHLWYADMLKLQRRFNSALNEVNAAQSLDPSSTAVLTDKGDIFLTMGRTKDAEQLFHNMETVEPTQMWPHAYLSRLALSQHNYAYYLTEARLTEAAKGDWKQRKVLDAAQDGFAKGGGQELLKSMLAAQTALMEQGVGSPYEVACTYAQQDQAGSAVGVLHKAAEQHDPHVLEALTDPCFERLRQSQDLSFINAIVLGT